MNHCCRELHKASLYFIRSFCRQGVKRGAFQLPRLFQRSVQSWRSLLPLSACSIRKQNQLVDLDRCSITLMFSFITLFHALSHNESWWKQTDTPWGLRVCLDMVDTLLDRKKGVEGLECLCDQEKDPKCLFWGHWYENWGTLLKVAKLICHCRS